MNHCGLAARAETRGDTVDDEAEMPVALATTASSDNVTSMIQSVDGFERGDFDLVVTASDVDQTKPDSAAHSSALNRLGVDHSSTLSASHNSATFPT